MHRPRTLLSTLSLALLAGTPLAASAPAHEDDHKTLDRLPRYTGPGVTTGTPQALGLATPGMPAAAAAGGLTASGAQGSGGVEKAIVVGKDFPQQGVHLLSWMTLIDLWDQQSSSNCWGYTSPSGREYALMGLNGGTGFVEVTDPGNPVKVAFIPGADSQWHDVRTYQQYAYAVSEGNDGILVIDISQIDSGIVTQVNKVTTGGSNSTHTLTINEDSGYLYRSGGGGNGLRIYSLANPANPTYVGAWTPRYVHAATVVSYTSGPYAGKEIAFCCGGLNNGATDTGVDILDVTDKSNIQYLSHTSYTARAYAHQAWPTEDLQYLYVGDELDENGTNKTVTKVLDISDLSNPVELPEFTSSKKAISHNIYVKGDTIFEANYTAGLRVFDASDPENPVETSWFDTYPEGSNASFNGLWHAYPFFPSGLVIGSDIEKGLFCWWVGDKLIDFSYAAGQHQELFDPAGDTFQVTVGELNTGDLTPGTEQFHYNLDGAGWVTVPLANLGGGLYEAPVPPSTCGQEFAYYVSARSSNGFTWTDPPGAPGVHHLATSGALEVVGTYYDFEVNPGWSKGDPTDDATFGKWARNKPIANGGQPGNDKSAIGQKCWFTGNSTVGFSAIENNVDDGKTTLHTDVLDLTGYQNPLIGYWRWYSNFYPFLSQTPFEDVFVIDITNDGTSWVNVETIGPTGPEVIGGWIHHQFRVQDFVTPTSTVQLRFIASDYNNPSLVEAAIDDFEVIELGCTDAGPVNYCTAGTSASGCVATVSASGTPSASASAGFDLMASGVEGQKDGLFFWGTNGRQANSWGSGTSFQCVVPPVIRGGLLIGSGSVGACDGDFTQDLNALWCASCPRPLKNPGAGAVVQAQLWYRDPLNTSNQTTSLSDALEFTVAP